jgi:hypothetical protein
MQSKQMTPKVQKAIDRLREKLAAGTAKLTVERDGSVTFRGWTDKEGLCDGCAYRTLAASNSPELRKALARAEALSGRRAAEGRMIG